MKAGEKWTDIPKPLLEDCAQLTKANSIEGNKKDNVTIIYTPWSNLRKDASMATGQVSFVSRPLLTPHEVCVPFRQPVPDFSGSDSANHASTARSEDGQESPCSCAAESDRQSS